MNTMQTIAERITKQRIARGFSQRALSEKLGISRTTLSSIERGEEGVTMGTLLKVMDFLDMTLESKKVVRLPVDGVFTGRPTLMQIMAMREKGLFA
ncbi:helix-turn-helix transcriptional regulator [Acidithiobacillus thiooxidans]|uniref:helix-turn-helix domain-containing protein n=1 Tax=Acidithiobacillus thiooxidans TaxID=930 RepID=UPI001C07581F|nr:helix-turn-helix transcriptional regulator [Acidithiobacillus thiooxidans]MBU2792784.1 helix-turn-helix transcriptional regulator [Acidithiobacillus thiooxidans]